LNDDYFYLKKWNWWWLRSPADLCHCALLMSDGGVSFDLHETAVNKQIILKHSIKQIGTVIQNGWTMFKTLLLLLK